MAAKKWREEIGEKNKEKTNVVERGEEEGIRREEIGI